MFFDPKVIERFLAALERIAVALELMAKK